MKIPRFIYIFLFFISVVIVLSTFYTHFVIKIISVGEMLELMILFGGMGAVLLILSKDDPIGKLLTRQKIIIAPHKILYVSVISTILGVAALCNVFFGFDLTEDKITPIIFGVTFITFGFIGIAQLIRKKIR